MPSEEKPKRKRTYDKANRSAYNREYNRTHTRKERTPEQKEKNNAQVRERRKLLRDTDPAYADKQRDQRRKLHRRNPTHSLFRSCLQRARVKGWEFSIESGDIVIPTECPIFHSPFVFIDPNDPDVYSGPHSPHTPTVDRIDSSKGYVKGNVWVIGYRANFIKNDSNLLELEQMICAIEKQEQFAPIINGNAPLLSERELLWGARARAKRKGLELDIDLSDILIPDVCPVFGVPMHKSKGDPNPFSPTLDRIDPTKGYVKGNVWVISYRANRIKSNATLQELKLLVSALRLKMEEIASKAA